MAHAVSLWLITAEARVRARIGPRGICGGQSGTGTGFSPSSSGFPCIIPPSLNTELSPPHEVCGSSDQAIGSKVIKVFLYTHLRSLNIHHFGMT
jgi:hypothetical protein